MSLRKERASSGVNWPVRTNTESSVGTVTSRVSARTLIALFTSPSAMREQLAAVLDDEV